MEEKTNESDNFWSDGAFAETLSAEDVEKKERTIHMSNEEEMNFNCSKCNVKISAHNKDWHNGMCDDCYDKEYFPDEQDSLNKWIKNEK